MVILYRCIGLQQTYTVIPLHIKPRYFDIAVWRITSLRTGHIMVVARRSKGQLLSSDRALVDQLVIGYLYQLPVRVLPVQTGFDLTWLKASAMKTMSTRSGSPCFEQCSSMLFCPLQGGTLGAQLDLSLHNLLWCCPAIFSFVSS